MPSTRYSEQALELRREKSEYAAAFPGLLRDWREARGKSVEAVCGTGRASVLVFGDGSFIVGEPGPAGAEELLQALDSAHAVLGRHAPDAVKELDRRIGAEREAIRLARMEKVLGAVETNLPQIPELREQLLLLLKSEQ